MINLKNYIIESIFDIEDNIDNMEYEIFQPLRSPSTFLDTYEKLDNHFKKKKWLVGSQKVEVGKVYIVFNRTERNYPGQYPYFDYSVSLCIPRSSFWEAYSIKKYEFVNSKYNLPKNVNDKKILFTENHAFFPSQFKKSKFTLQTIYELPDSYKGIINMFKK